MEIGVTGLKPDGRDDLLVLLDWLESIVFSIECTNQITLPLRIRNIVKNSLGDNNGEFTSVLQRILYVSSTNLALKYKSCNSDVISFFSWIECCTNNLNFIYNLLKFEESDVVLLKRTEFFLYKESITEIWNDIFNFFVFPSSSSSCSSSSISRPTTSFSSNLNDLYLVAKVLLKINLFDELDTLIFEISKTKILNQIDSIYSEDPLYETLYSWILDDLYPFFETLISFRNKNRLKTCLLLILKNNLLLKRIENIYELVEHFPVTKDTLQEFNICLNNDNQRNLLINTFITKLESNLLLPSIKTLDIILYYIKTIHSFLVIDHRGVLLDKVTRSIRSYLSRRNDTIEKVVTGLLSDDRSNNKLIELNDELNKNWTNLHNCNSFQSTVQKRTLNWQPDPVDALPDFQIGKIDDIIESLISIFDDDSLIINQFVNLFSVELLNIDEYTTSTIVTNLRLLKSKFSNLDFNQLDIMLNDIIQSRSLNEKIERSPLQPLDGFFKIHGMFLSHLYWPNVSTNAATFKLPEVIEANLLNYTSAYKKLQKNRDLKLHPQKSTADIKIELENGVMRTFKVSFDKLAVLNLMMESRLTNAKIGIICMKLKMPLQAVKSSLEFWVSENIMTESNGSYSLVE